MDQAAIIEHLSSEYDAVPGGARRDSMRLLEPIIPPNQENAESPQETKKRFPISVLFIVLSEFCERFSFYGLQAVLVIYLNTALGMTAFASIAVFHLFVMTCYFTPLLGSMLADGYLGKFRTIYYVSIMYALGSLVLTASSIPQKLPMMGISMVALVIIAVSTGGIKPCVSAFGGDQFDNDQVKQRDRFFFIYYFAINAGSLISMFITPILKSNVGCFGQETCYPLAFAVPAFLMVISVVIFVVGRNRYKMNLATDNALRNFFKCIWHAIANLRRSERRNREHWLDYADDEFETQFLSDVKAVIRVWFLYVPLPVFWALFGLQGSLWTFQAQALDGSLSNSYAIIPEQMQVVNPMLILMFIPLFNSVIYPRLANRNIFTKPLTRMIVGGLFAAAACFLAALLQICIERTYPSKPTADHTDIVFINNGPCALQVQSLSSTLEVTSLSLNITLDDKKFFSEHMNVLVGKMEIMHILVKPAEGHQCQGFPEPSYPIFSVNTMAGSAYTVVLYEIDNDVKIIQRSQLRKKPANAHTAAIRLAYNLAVAGSYLMIMEKGSKVNCTYAIGSTNIGITTYGDYGIHDDYCNTKPGTYLLYLPNGNDKLVNTGIEIHPRSGGQYVYVIHASGFNNENVSVDYYLEVPVNDISMLWQIPQYVLITCAEIMFSITGFQFSYSQAPASMKSVLQASFLLTVGFGHVLIIIISELTFVKYSYQFLEYAAIMALVMLIFSFMCKNYVYVTIDSDGNVVYPQKEEDEQERTQRTAEPNPDEPVAALQ